MQKQKCLNLGPKMPYLGIFDQKMSYLGILNQIFLIWIFLGKMFRKTVVIFEISTLKFVYLQNSWKKTPKFGTKNV